MAAIAEVVRSFRFLGKSVGRSVEVGSVALAADAAEDCEGLLATAGLVIGAASS